MTFNFTEEQIMIRDMVREFTKKEVEPRDKWMDENGFDYELHKKLTQAGLMGIHLDEKYGGGGGDAVTSIIVIHEIAKGSASEALFLDANWLAADLILYHGTEAQKDKYLPQAAQGKIFAFGLTESCAGSDAAGIKSTVVPADDGGWILNGGKAWITNSGVADYYIILAKTDPAAGNKGISAFIVPKDAEGLTIGKFEDKMGMRGSATCELSFDNIHLPADALLGSLGMGFKMAMQALDGARISIGAIAAGLAEHAMTIAKNYANERTAFGKPIGKFEGIQFKFADMSAEIRAMELMTYDTARMKAEGKRHTLEAAQTKLFSGVHCTQICLECQQVLGGNGYSKEYHVERFVRDAKLLEIGEGTNEILRMLIGGTVLAQK
ncbi:MAG: acyl-CoA dehydrogenase family protein [Oscillospiraceae bacterium]|jgi:acyl-coA dehydrogenase|nr:acyl-CoA dehydrogenase family protein [Bacillota bacterium]MEE0794929.1 acyl-CoA dehydrogenase family protein [Oscillospiraceae bacterium]